MADLQVVHGAVQAEMYHAQLWPTIHTHAWARWLQHQQLVVVWRML
jgi:Fe-S cluster biosynthesis and repair protein YggX